MPASPRFRVCLARVVVALLTVVAGVVGVPRPASAVTAPAGFTHTTVASGLSTPTAMAFSPDGRIFVSEKGGKLRVIKGGTLLPTPFVTVTVDGSGERGLLGVTFDPGFATNGYVYVYYTATTPAVHNRLVRFTAQGDVAKKVGGAVEQEVLLDLPDLPASKIHNGGALHFGPDGKLYVTLGDAATGANAQSLGTVFGKMLRLNADGSIPPDNPFYDRTTGMNRAIWAMGLRNPFTFDFEPGTGKMMINDVGQETWEELDEGIAGANYGWPTTEGPTTDPRFKTPVFAYRHAAAAPAPSGCAVTGGAFYTTSTPQFPAEYRGDYFFADFCDHWIKRLDLETGKVHPFIDASSPHPVDLRVGSDGNLYYLSLGAGSVVRVGYGTGTAPQIGEQPHGTVAGVGESATFSVSATGGGLNYQWQRNGVAIGGDTGSVLQLHDIGLDEDGDQFRVVVSNTSGSVTSSAAMLVVTTNTLPVPAIELPIDGAQYAGGEPFDFSGSASDEEDGALPPSAFTWRVDFNHDNHAHPYVEPFGDTSAGSFTTSTSGHTEDNVWYRIHLTATDSEGRSASTFRDVVPRKAPITISTQPAGLALDLDAQPRSTPLTVTGVAGVVRTLTAPLQQTVGGSAYEFVSWSDGGAASHQIVTPELPTTYRATYRLATTVTRLAPVADAYVNEGATAKNFGTSGSLAARAASPGQVSYLRFALPNAPAGQELTSASLRIRTSSESFAGSADRIYVRPGGDGWTETGLTWNNRPSVSPTTLGTFAPATTPNGTYDAVLDRDLVQGLLGGGRTLTLTTEGADNVYLWSRNHGTATYRPQLSLTFSDVETEGAPPDTSPPSAPANLTTSTSGSFVSLAWSPSVEDTAVTAYDVHRSAASGFTPSAGNRVAEVVDTDYTDPGVPAGTWYYRVVARNAAGLESLPSEQAAASVASSQPVVMTLVPTADAYGNQGAATTNYGSSASLASSGAANGQVSYLRFVLPAAPSGRTLTGVSLRLRTSSESFSGSTLSQAVRLAGDGWTEAGLTWNNKPALGATLGSVGAVNGNTVVSASLEPSLLRPLTGSTVTLSVSGTGTDNLWFWSRNHANADYRPHLVVTFS